MPMREFTKKQIGWILLVVSLVLLAIQFTLGFTTNVLPSGYGVTAFIVNMAPYGLFLISLYLLFGKSKLPPHRGGIRLLVTVIVSFSIGGVIAFMSMIICLFAFGSQAMTTISSNMLLIIAVLSVVVFPIVSKKLR